MCPFYPVIRMVQLAHGLIKGFVELWVVVLTHRLQWGSFAGINPSAQVATPS